MATGGTASATGNVTGGNLLTGGLISATSTITSTANISGGNLLTGGLVSATGNLIGGAVNTSTIRPTSGALTVSTATGDINLNPAGNIVLATGNTYINNLAQPVQNQDAATKLYVDNLASAGISYHQPVYAATNTTLAVATGGTISYAQPNGVANGVGATLTTTGSFNLIDTANVQTVGTRILVQSEGNAVYNGVYTWSNATAIVRSTDTDEYGSNSTEQLSINDYFFTTNGNVNAGTAFVVSAPAGTITFGTSNITFSIFSQQTTYTANTAAGLSLTGTVFSAKTDNNTTAFDGSGNIIVKAGANLTTPNIGAATGTSLSATGNIQGGNLTTGGLISSTGTITGSTLIGSVVTATGNVYGGNVLTGGLISATSTITSAANISGGNVLTGGLISSTGTITGSTLIGSVVTASGNVTGGNVLTGGLISATSTITSGANISGGNLLTGGLISSTGTITSGNVLTGGLISSTGTITGGNVLTDGLISSTGTITGGNLLTGGLVSATGNAIFGNISTSGPSGNIAGANVISSTTLSATANVSGGNLLTGGLITATGNVTGGNILTAGQVSAVGNITANTGSYFIGNGSQLTGVTATSAGFPIVAGTSNIAGVFNGNISVTVGGTPNVAVFATTGEYVTGVISANGTVTGGNLVTGGSVTATGNITGGNVLTGGLISATSTITSAANISGGNVLTGGLISATANITGGNLVSSGQISASGNVNIGTNYYFGNGSQLTGIITSVSNINNGTSNVTVVSSGGNITVGVGGTGNVAVFATTGEYITGLLSVSGNVTGGNVLTGGLISSTGSITSAANITGGNLLTGGLISATSTVTGSSLLGSVVSVTGNITGGNIASTGLISTSGNLAGGNILSNNYYYANGQAIVFGVNYTAATTPPSSPGNGWQWYNTSTDVLYEFLNDGTSYYWVDVSSPAFSNGPAGNLAINGNLIAGANAVYNIGSAVQTFNNVYAQNYYGNGASLSGIITSVANINNGTSNVTVVSSGGNITASVGGTSNVLVVSNGLVEVNGNLTVTGNATLQGNILGDRITNGTTSFEIQTASGNANINIGGTGNLAVFAPGNLVMTGNINPSANVTYNLGSTTQRWNDLWLANSTIYMGNAQISANATSLIFTNPAGGQTVLAGASAGVTGATVSATGNITGGNITTAGILTVNSGGAATAIVNGASNVVGNIGSTSSYFNRLFAQATTALYADLAENYVSDADYTPGTVLDFGGTQEVTISTVDSSKRVAGVVSTNPAHLMNAGVVGEHVVTVALIGRVPVSVTGTVSKGDLMVSAGDGTARAVTIASPKVGTIIGKSLEDFNGDKGTIEIVIGKH